MKASDMAFLMKALSGDPLSEMIDMERRMCFEPIEVDSVPWYTSADWRASLVSRRDEYVRIVAIMAKTPRNGAFKRLMHGIVMEGKTPFVVEPFRDMTQILVHWGWRQMQWPKPYEHIAWTPRDGWSAGIRAAALKGV